MWCFIFVFVYMVFVSVQLDTGYSFTSVPNSNPTIDTEIGTFGDIVVFYIDLHWFKFGLPPFSFENGPNGGASQQDRLLLSGLSAKPKPDHHSHSNWRFQTNLLQFYINHNISSQHIAKYCFQANILQNIAFKPTFLQFYIYYNIALIHVYM